ncbi:HD-GYP domain-containing protein [Herbidospora cretacea]|uniref:HD-GYP domain-containing protein n=1 Tax=Herbidospora cretacea TaxID=28444 RepID=UPI0006898656|nr:HD domain-containing phosphohydrolase [Herbidospora cretacea]
MTIDDLIRQMAPSLDTANDEQALAGFTAAARHADSDPAEARRIDALADLVDAEISAYDWALAALDHGDADTAQRLLLQTVTTVTTGMSDAEDILAELLSQQPETPLPSALRQRTADIRAQRAIITAVYRTPRPASRPSTAVSVPDILENLTQVLMTAMETKDPHTCRHSERIPQLVTWIGQHLALPPDQIHAARLGGLLHDIGKLAVPSTVLGKLGPITEEEYLLIQRHSVYGAALVSDASKLIDDTGTTARSTLLQHALAGIRHHHERFDGRGYPDGLAGTDIPQIARMIAVADAFDAMTTTRSTHRRSIQEAAHVLHTHRGQLFDPEIVDAFLQVLHTHADQIDESLRRDSPLTDAGIEQDTSAATDVLQIIERL